MKYAVSSLVLAVLLASPAAPARAQDRAPRWLLGFEHGPLRVVTLEAPGRRVETWHYMTMKVTNATEFPRTWSPVARAVTDTGQIRVAAGHKRALEAIRNQEGSADLVVIEDTLGKIQPQQTLHVVAIFGELDPQYDHVRIQVLGLVDPIAVYKVREYPTGTVVIDPAYAARNETVLSALRQRLGEAALPKPEEKYQEVAERRAYEIRYERIGDEFRPYDDPITRRSEGWTIVGEPKVIRTIPGM
jgi:hypothetical protein